MTNKQGIIAIKHNTAAAVKKSLKRDIPTPVIFDSNVAVFSTICEAVSPDVGIGKGIPASKSSNLFPPQAERAAIPKVIPIIRDEVMIPDAIPL